MSVAELPEIKKEIIWIPTLVKRLRGTRTQAEFGKLLGVPKNTVWRWEAGYATPDAQRAQRLSELAERERFLENWEIVGSVSLIGDLEEGSKQIIKGFKKSLSRRSLGLTE